MNHNNARTSSWLLWASRFQCGSTIPLSWFLAVHAHRSRPIKIWKHGEKKKVCTMTHRVEIVEAVASSAIYQELALGCCRTHTAVCHQCCLALHVVSLYLLLHHCPVQESLWSLDQSDMLTKCAVSFKVLYAIFTPGDSAHGSQFSFGRSPFVLGCFPHHKVVRVPRRRAF